MIHHRRRVTFTALALTIGFLALGTWVVSLIGVLVWQQRDDARPAAAIVVLGAAQYAGHPSPVLRARLDHALDLWRGHLAPRLILTGGKGEGDTTSEAAVGRRYVERHGVADSAVFVEQRGRTTSESMLGVAAIMRRQGARDVILVSDPFHMLRLSILARRLGLTPLVSPTRTSPISASTLESLRYALSESVKVPLTCLFGTREP